MGTDSNQLHKPSDASMAAGYELSTVSVRGLIYFVIGLIIVAAVVHAGIWFLLRTYEKVYLRYSRPGSAVVDRQTRLPLPPPPRLQPNPGSTNVPEADLQLMYSKEDELFTRMGWRINPQTHVPVEIPRSAIDQVIRDHPQPSRSSILPDVAQPPSAVFGRSPKSEASTSSSARTQPRAAVPHKTGSTALTEGRS